MESSKNPNVSHMRFCYLYLTSWLVSQLVREVCILLPIYIVIREKGRI